MGRGIAALAAQKGFGVQVLSSRAGRRDEVRSRFDADCERMARRDPEGAAAAYERIDVCDTLDELDATLVIESVIEHVATKLEVLRAIEEAVPPDALIGTNTSSLPLNALAEGLNEPGRFCALHFFNPPTKMPLVEVAAAHRTSNATIERAAAFCRSLEQTPIQVQGVPGYLVNRLMVPQLLHAIGTLSEGVGSIEAIDAAMTLGASHPMGPLALADYIGLDVVLAMARTLHAELRDPRFDPPALLVSLVEKGDLGRKSGSGFYRYQGRERTPNRQFEGGRNDEDGRA